MYSPIRRQRYAQIAALPAVYTKSNVYIEFNSKNNKKKSSFGFNIEFQISTNFKGKRFCGQFI